MVVMTVCTILRESVSQDGSKDGVDFVARGLDRLGVGTELQLHQTTVVDLKRRPDELDAVHQPLLLTDLRRGDEKVQSFRMRTELQDCA